MRSARAATLVVGMLVIGMLNLVGCGPSPRAQPEKPTSPARSSAGLRPTSLRPAAPSEQDDHVSFEDVAPACGVDFAYRNGEESDHYTILETLGGGVALFDFDCDGRLDIFLTGGGEITADAVVGRPNRLYRNLGEWRFEDVTAAAGLSDLSFYSHGAFVADYDNDGWPDLLITGYGRSALLRNAEGRFVDVTEAAGLAAKKTDRHWSTAAAWGDLNGDDRLDLFVTHYVDWSLQNNPVCDGGADAPRDVCSPNRFHKLFPQLFLAGPDGRFRECAAQAGLVGGRGLGAVLFDANDDGRLDIYVANDALHNHLYINQGEARFRERGVPFGVALGEIAEADGSMGVETLHFPDERRASLFVTNYQAQQHALYRSTPNDFFDHASQRLGVAAIGRNYVGWGIAAVDLDRDGDQDLVLANGHVFPAPRRRVAAADVVAAVANGGRLGRGRTIRGPLVGRGRLLPGPAAGTRSGRRRSGRRRLDRSRRQPRKRTGRRASESRRKIDSTAPELAGG